MKASIIILALLVSACAKHRSSKSPTTFPTMLTEPTANPDITDPLTPPGDQQQQGQGHIEQIRNYNGTNVVLNYRSSNHIGLIRVRGNDAEKLHKHMALTTIHLQSDFLKSDLEAKVGRHLMCRNDACWVYIDYKNGDVRENKKISEFADAKKIIRTYRGPNVEMQMVNRAGKIFVNGTDAKALYSAMAVPEYPHGGKGSIGARKSGDGLSCVRYVTDDALEKESYTCEVKFNHRTGSMKEQNSLAD